MTNTLTTIMISHFGSQEINVVQATGQPEPGVTRQVPYGTRKGALRRDVLRVFADF